MKIQFHIFCFLLLKFTFSFSQKQVSNFVYPSVEAVLNYTYLKSENDKNFLWFQNQKGVFCLDIAKKQTTQIMLSDSIAAASIHSFFVNENGNGTIILTDSFSNFYISTSENNIIKIHYIIYKPLKSDGSNFTPKIYHYKNRLLFFDENTLYELKNTEIIVLDTFQKPLSLVADTKNWAVMGQDSLNYNGIKTPLNPYWTEKRITFTPIFNKNTLYLYSTNKIWKFDESKNRLDSLQSFKNPIGLFTQNDSLFVEENLSSLYLTRNLYLLNNSGLKLFRKYPNSAFGLIVSLWEDTNLKAKAFIYYGLNMSFEIENPKKFIYLPISTGSTSDVYHQLDMIQKRDSTYLFHLKSANKSYYISSSIKKDTIINEVSEALKMLNDSLVLVAEKNFLKVLNTKTLKKTIFLTYPQNFVNTPNFPDFNYFLVGKHNLAYANSYQNLELIKDFRNNKSPVLINNKAINSSMRFFFINDSLVSIPQSRFIGRSPNLFGKQDFYISLGVMNDSLYLYDVLAKKYFSIKLSNDDNLQQIWVNGKSEIVLVYANEIALWKNDVVSTLRENIASIYVFIDKADSFWAFFRDNHNGQVEIVNYSNAKLSSRQLIKSPQNYGFSIEKIGGDFLKLRWANNSQLIFKLSSNDFREIPTFWSGTALNVWVDKKNNIYCLAEDKDNTLKIFSSKSLKVPLVDFFPKGLSSVSQGVVNEKGDVYFTSYLDNQSVIVKYNKSTNKYSYIENMNLLEYWRLDGSILFETKLRNEQFFHVIDESGEKQLNEKPIYYERGNLNSTKTFNDIFYVIGNLKDATKQIFELDTSEAVNANLEWVLLENQREIANNEGFGQIMAYPNPFNEKISFSFIDVPGITHIGVYDSRGSQILFDFAPNFLKPYFEEYQPESELLLQKNKRQYLSELLERSLVSLPSGIYFVKFYLDEFYWNKAITLKVVKQ